jgi:hypothetical protein
LYIPAISSTSGFRIKLLTRHFLGKPDSQRTMSYSILTVKPAHGPREFLARLELFLDPLEFARDIDWRQKSIEEDIEEFIGILVWYLEGLAKLCPGRQLIEQKDLTRKLTWNEHQSPVS